MHKKLILTAAILLPAFCAQAQSTPEKKALAARIVKTQQAAIEGAGRALAERPAMAMLDQAGAALQTRIAPDKREAVGKDIQADVKKYLDEAVPLVRDRAVKLAPQTVGALLEEKFTEDELKQLAGMLESPAYNKYLQLGGDMQKSLVEKLVADTRGAIEPKVKALELAVGKRLGVSAPAAPAAPAPAPKASSAK
jgi:hypothetical protein